MSCVTLTSKSCIVVSSSSGSRRALEPPKEPESFAIRQIYTVSELTRVDLQALESQNRGGGSS